MTRTVWGAHKRYMDTYFNVYKGYYVSIFGGFFEKISAKLLSVHG
jgi:acyl-coenzyme A synthetase/AMP-(fatty) acid ligase